MDQFSEKESLPSEEIKAPHFSASRSDLQLPRRFFHMTMGSLVAMFYQLFLDHHESVYILGTVACIAYIFEQVRIAYPEYSSKFAIATKYFYRAEEQLKESAGIPYAMGLLLTILTFPKTQALAAIYTLALADPLSAIIGIKWGKNKIVGGKTFQGSMAFVLASFVVTFVTFSTMHGPVSMPLFAISFLGALCTGFFELAPIRIDDNLTIPLFHAAILWLLTLLIAPQLL